MKVGNDDISRRMIAISSQRLQYNERIKIIRRLTCVGSTSTIRSGGGGPISGLHLQGKCSLLLPVEHLLGEDFTGLGVDLESILALVPDAVHNVIVHLVVGKGSVLVNCVDPENYNIL